MPWELEVTSPSTHKCDKSAGGSWSQVDLLATLDALSHRTLASMCSLRIVGFGYQRRQGARGQVANFSRPG